jgi:hypothetical protein
VYAGILKIGSVIVTVFGPVAAAPELEVELEDAARTAEVVSSAASSGGAFDPHAVPTLAATIAAAIKLVNIFDFKANFNFVRELNFMVVVSFLQAGHQQNSGKLTPKRRNAIRIANQLKQTTRGTSGHLGLGRSR